MHNDTAMQRLCHLDELPDPGARGFDPHTSGHDTVFVVRRGLLIRAYRDACPHYGSTPLAWRRHGYLNGDGTRIVCHAHGAQFDIGSGACLLGACLGQSLQRVALSIGADGVILFDSAPSSS